MPFVRREPRSLLRGSGRSWIWANAASITTPMLRRNASVSSSRRGIPFVCPLLTVALYGLLTTMVVPSLSASGSWLLAG